MPKLKTIKAVVKRIKITKKNKLKQKKAGQNHFNAREGGKDGTKKRRSINTPETLSRTIKSLMPYN
jgi:ribosomal protein L35